MFRFLTVLVAVTFLVVLDLIVLYGYVYAQGNQNGQSINNMTNGSSNSSGIMRNTTGMIDDAFDALKDSFGSFFENR